MSIIPTDLKIKTFSETDSRKYIEFPVSEGFVFQLSLVGYGTGLLEDYYNYPMFLSRLSVKDKTIHPLYWFYSQRMGVVEKAYNLLSVYDITKDVANFCLESYVENYRCKSKPILPKKLIENRKHYFNLWTSKIVSSALKEVIESFNLNPDFIDINKKAFSVLGPVYRSSRIAEIVRLKTRDKKRFEPLFQNILNGELSTFLTYIFSYFPFGVDSTNLDIETFIRNYVNSDTKNFKVTEYCIKNIPTALPLNCVVDYGYNLGRLEEPIFGRIEYKYFLADSYRGRDNTLILTKSDIKYLTNMFFGGKITFPTILKLRRAVDSTKARNMDELVIKLNYIIESRELY